MVSLGTLDEAGRATIGQVAEHLRAATAVHDPEFRSLPSLRQGDPIRRLDARLELASLHARTAVSMLDELDHPALRDARDAAVQLAESIDARIARPRPADRWHGPYDYPSSAIARQQLELTNGLEAVATDQSATWLTRSLNRYEDNLVAQRMVAELDPKLAHVAAWMPSQAVGNHRAEASYVLPALAAEPGDTAAALQQAWWQYMLSWLGRGTKPTIPAGDLRRIYEATSDAWKGTVRHPMPDWLAAAPADEVLRLDAEDLLELELRMRGMDRATAEAHVSLMLTYPNRGSLVHGVDFGELTARASQRLPEEARPVIPPRAVQDGDVARAWATEVSERDPRAELAASTAPPAQQLRDILDGGTARMSSIRGRTRVALELARALEPRTEAGATVRDLLATQLQLNAVKFDQAWHVEYAEHGRALALADTLAALERTPAEDVSRIGAELSADTDRIVAESDALAW